MANPNTDEVIMQAIAMIIPAKTRLGSLNNPIIIENEYMLSKGRFPAVHLESTRQRHKINSYGSYNGEARFLLSYYDRWDRASQLIDDIRKQIKIDLQQMMTNLQGNPTLSTGGAAHATSIYEFELSPYQGSVDDRTVPGLTLIKRTMIIRVNILPYDV